jgi:acyl carrier protein
MNRLDVINKLRDIFQELTPEIPFDELNFHEPFRAQVEVDSLDLYRIFVRIHRTMGILMPDSKLESFMSLDDLINYISEQPIHRPPPGPGL